VTVKADATLFQKNVLIHFIHKTHFIHKNLNTACRNSSAAAFCWRSYSYVRKNI